MSSRESFLIATLPIFLLAGCSSIGNVVITPHPDSLREGTEEIVLKKSTEDQCLPRPSGEKEREKAIKEAQERLGMVVGPAAIIGFTVSGVVKLLEEEAKQYKDSYSTTISADFHNFNCISFASKNKVEKAKEVLANFNIYLSKEDPALRLNIDKLQLSGFRSKIAAWPLVTLIKGSNPWAGDSLSSKIGNTIGWVNPLMIIHAVYSLFDWDDIYSVETQVKIRIDSVVTMGQQRSLANVGSVELPPEKHSIFDLKPINLSGPINSSKPKPVMTGYLALPVGPKVPTNLFVTVLEGNDFGNVVGKGAKQVGEKKDSIINKLGEWLGG